MTRVDREEKQPEVVTRQQYEADRQRGYCILVFHPEREEVIQDPRSKKTITRKVPATLVFRCMDCQFDSVNEDLIKKHRFHGDECLWPYTPFKNPYGYDADVVIEGIEDYSAIQGEQK